MLKKHTVATTAYADATVATIDATFTTKLL